MVPGDALGALGEHMGPFKLLDGWIDHMGDVWCHREAGGLLASERHIFWIFLLGSRTQPNALEGTRTQHVRSDVEQPNVPERTHAENILESLWVPFWGCWRDLDDVAWVFGSA